MEHIHPIAQSGFNHSGQIYQHGRPGYPLELLDFLLKKFSLSSESSILDLGAGTGKFTDLLIETKGKIIAVEPVEEMKNIFSANYPYIPLYHGRAEQIPLPNQSQDLVCVAQAFHWFDGPKALREIHRVLKPGGHLLLLWNVQNEKTIWNQEIVRLFAPYTNTSPTYQGHDWHRAFTECPLFSLLHQRQFNNPHLANTQILVDRFSSISSIASLDSETRKQLKEQVSHIIQNSDEIEDVNRITINYLTNIYWCQSL